MGFQMSEIIVNTLPQLTDKVNALEDALESGGVVSVQVMSHRRPGPGKRGYVEAIVTTWSEDED